MSPWEGPEWLAVAAVVAATLLSRPRPASPAPPRRAGRADGRDAAGLPVVGVGLLALAAGTGWLGARDVALAGTGAAVVAGVLGLAARGRRRRAEAALADEVLEACSALADELRAGRSPERALELAARDCRELEPALRAARLGADVPAALRRGRHRDLRLLAAAWQVSHRSGEGLATALGRVADGLVRARATRQVVASELASARSTARLLVALPGLALLAGGGAGGRPWEFLLTTTVGVACLVGGLALALGGLWWIEAIAGDVERGP
ncbi:type II secretion system F family protein [Nocardioides solisilvae]|uniref:type II secretion system F family protein n=1 Tax=Nocardioides solisilvae TaxID=1542435 RepID=UPI000D740AF7|nr:type II secretion system F family protein [Nocardioides solisilvae]